MSLVVRMPSCRGVLALAASIAVAGAVAIPAGSPSAQAPAPIPIKVGTSGQDANAECYYAYEMGFFKKNGLEADIHTIRRGSGAAVAAAAAGGSIDVGEADVIAIAAAREHGLSLSILAPSSVFVANSPASQLVVAKSATLKTAKDLEDKTVAVVSLEGPSKVATAKWLETNGANLSKIKFVELPQAQMPSSVERGAVAAAVMSEPTLTVATSGNARVFANSFESVGKRWQIGAWFATTDWIKKNPDAAKRFVAALHETALWANEKKNHPRSGAILDQYTKFDPDVLGKMTRATYAETIDPATMQPILDAATTYKSLQKSVSAKEMISTYALAR